MTDGAVQCLNGAGKCPAAPAEFTSHNISYFNGVTALQSGSRLHINLAGCSAVSFVWLLFSNIFSEEQRGRTPQSALLGFSSPGLNKHHWVGPSDWKALCGLSQKSLWSSWNIIKSCHTSVEDNSQILSKVTLDQTGWRSWTNDCTAGI